MQTNPVKLVSGSASYLSECTELTTQQTDSRIAAAGRNEQENHALDCTMLLKYFK